MDRTLLILDLDETLVYASEQLAGTCDFSAGPYGVLKRPHVNHFLDTVRQWYDLAVWTSASRGYASVVVEHLFRDSQAELRFCWCSENCTLRYDLEERTYFGAKNLRKLKKRGYRLERVLVVDDSPEKHSQNYGNLIRVTPWMGEPSDTELLDLLSYLESLRAVTNVRAIEKRGWRARGTDERADVAR